MSLQAIGFELPAWSIYWLLATLAGPVLVPIISGIACGSFMDWISPWLGFAAGMGTAIVGGISYFVFMLMGRERIFPDSELEAGAAFGSLAAAIIAQVLVTAGICWFINHQRGRSWGIRRW